MFQPGIVSVTYRKLSPLSILNLAAQAGLSTIEWGGDIHVPHGDRSTARAVAQQTRDAGLTVAAYGSYYRIWPHQPLPFAEVLATAAALGAPRIRVWAGTAGSKQAPPDLVARIAAEAHDIAAQAAREGIQVTLEYHANTLTDTADSALALLRAANHPNLFTYWQPPVGMDFPDALDGLCQMLPYLAGLHIFQWLPAPQGTARLPLAEGAAAWQQYLALAATIQQDLPALLEFVPDDHPDLLIREAQTLKEIIQRVEQNGVTEVTQKGVLFS